MYFCYFVITVFSPWKRVGPFFWTNLIPLHPRMPFAKFGWNWLRGSGEEDFFKISSIYFSLFRNYFPLERGRAFIWRNLNPHYPRMLFGKFGWNWFSGSGEEDFFKISSMYFVISQTDVNCTVVLLNWPISLKS